VVRGSSQHIHRKANRGEVIMGGSEVVMEHLLKELSDNVKLTNTKLDDQAGKITELVVKVDMYRENQVKHETKIERLEDDIPTLKSELGHLKSRTDKLDKIVWTVVSFISLAVVGAIVNLVIQR
jgi:phage terminase large subunit-like protein